MTLLTGGKAYRNGVMDDVFVLVSETSSRVLPVSDAGSDAFSDVSEKIDIRGIDLEYIKSALNVKYERIMEHTYYTMSKNPNLTEDQREYFRKEYLDKKGVPDEFRR